MHQVSQLKPERSTILKVLKTKANMSYRKIKKVPVQGNTERCKVLRRLWGQQLLELLESGKRIINIDETWIPETDFRRHKWGEKGG